MTKSDTITYEWEHSHNLSPKSFNIKHDFIKLIPLCLGQKYVYNLQNIRTVYLFQAIDMEKYFVYIKNDTQHPLLP